MHDRISLMLFRERQKRENIDLFLFFQIRDVVFGDAQASFGCIS
jgi:hypothetical protein